MSGQRMSAECRLLLHSVWATQRAAHVTATSCESNAKTKVVACDDTRDLTASVIEEREAREAIEETYERPQGERHRAS